MRFSSACNCLLMILLIVIAASGAASSAASADMECDQRSWSTGDSKSITCRIATFVFNPHNCTGGTGASFQGLVDLKFQPNGSGEVPVARAYCLPGLQSTDNASCALSADGHTYVVTYRVTATWSSHDGGTWLCLPNCHPQSDPYNPISTGRCGPVQFVTKATGSQSTASLPIVTLAFLWSLLQRTAM